MGVGAVERSVEAHWNTQALTRIVLSLLVNTSKKIFLKMLDVLLSGRVHTSLCEPALQPQTSKPNYKENQVRRLER